MRSRFSIGIQRLICLHGGHRDLCHTVVYGAELGGLLDEELHYCSACGSAAWISVPHARQLPLSWAHAGYPDAVIHDAP